MIDKVYVSIGLDHIFNCTRKKIARTGESDATRLEITLADELCGCWAYLDFGKANGETFKTPKLDIVNNKVTYDIPLSVLDVDGELKTQAVFQKESGEIWKSDIKKFTVCKSIDATDDIPEKEDFITQAQSLLDKMFPIIEVETLPEVTEDAKNKVYLCNGCYYVAQSVMVGSGYFAVGNEFASGDKVTDRSQDDLMSPATKYANETRTLLYRFLDRSTGDERSVYWYGGGYYVSEGYFYFEGADYSDQYIMSFYDAPSYEYLYPWMYSYGSGCVEILEVTPMGVEFFGGVKTGWKNFLTGEDA